MNQREIKFRAWDDQLSKMEDFDFYSIWKRDIGHGYYDTIINESCLFSPSAGENPDLHIMQYTGLKDKNGKPIYEGDIINAETELKGDSQNLIVVYNPEYVGYTLTNQAQTDGAYLMNCEFWAEVIGNIYENSELLTPPQP